MAARKGGKVAECVDSCLQATSIADLSDEHEPHEDELCIVCLEKLREVITFPCGHMVRFCKPPKSCQACLHVAMVCICDELLFILAVHAARAGALP